jgi:hypothetical protein
MGFNFMCIIFENVGENVAVAIENGKTVSM